MIVRMMAAALAVVAAQAVAGEKALTYCNRPAEWKDMQADWREATQWINERNVEALERLFNGLIVSYERGIRSDLEVDGWFVAVDDSQAKVTPVLQEWVAKYPKSYAARLAYARHLFSRGGAKRGGKWAKDTSRAQFDAMEEDFRLALKVLDEAEGLSSKPTLSYSLRMTIARYTGPHEVLRKLLDKAIAIDPVNAHVRLHYIMGLRPRWGGSFDELEAYGKEVAASTLPVDLKNFLKYRIMVGYAEDLYEGADKETKRQAVHMFEEAQRICSAYVGGADQIVQFYVDAREFDVALAFLDRYREREPTRSWGFVRRGQVYLKMGRMNESLEAYRKSAEMGDPDGLRGVAWHYEAGKAVPRDLPRAIELYNLAARQGSSEAVKEAARARATLQKMAK